MHELGRRVLWNEETIPDAAVESGQTGLGNGRHAGQFGQAPAAADRDHLELFVGDQRQEQSRGPGAQIQPAGREIGQRRTSAFVAHAGKFDAGLSGKKIKAYAGRRQLCRISL